MTNLRISEAADKIGITPSTVRNYVNQFGNLLSESATRPTRKRFNPTDMKVLTEINELLRSGLTYAETADRMPAKPEIVDDTTVDQEEIPPRHPGAVDYDQQLVPMEFIEQIQQLLQQQHDTYKETINAKNELIDELKKDKAKMEEEISKMRRQWWRRF